jgi:very-short-patch-repair endonuclease
MRHYRADLKAHARSLRTNSTDAERALWSRIRRKQILGVQFYRQKPLSSFIVDFYCPAARLVIELDGSQHAEPEHTTKDHECDTILTAMELRVLRFDNRQVLTELEGVLAKMEMAVRETSRKYPGARFPKVGGSSSQRRIRLILEKIEPPQAKSPQPPFGKGGVRGAFRRYVALTPSCAQLQQQVGTPPSRHLGTGSTGNRARPRIRGNPLTIWGIIGVVGGRPLV